MQRLPSLNWSSLHKLEGSCPSLLLNVTFIQLFQVASIAEEGIYLYFSSEPEAERRADGIPRIFNQRQTNVVYACSAVRTLLYSNTCRWRLTKEWLILLLAQIDCDFVCDCEIVDGKEIVYALYQRRLN